MGVSLSSPAVDSGSPEMMAGNDREKCRLQEGVWSLRVRTIGSQPLPAVLLSREEQLGSHPCGRPLCICEEVGGSMVEGEWEMRQTERACVVEGTEVRAAQVTVCLRPADG